MAANTPEKSILSRSSLVNLAQSYQGIPATNYADLICKAKRPATSKLMPSNRRKKIEVHTKRVVSRDDQKSVRSNALALSSTLLNSENKLISERPLSGNLECETDKTRITLQNYQKASEARQRPHLSIGVLDHVN